eukprot:m.79409 g.79409  ORF g.79409 m.79409 type:complete len:59 (+) comp36136_c0_seq10:1127-1303(+)
MFKRLYINHVKSSPIRRGVRVFIRLHNVEQSSLISAFLFTCEENHCFQAVHHSYVAFD